MADISAAARLPKCGERYKDMIVAPCLLQDSTLDISIHKCPRRHVSHFTSIFGTDLDTNALLIIPTFRKADVDLVGVGPQIEDEKNRLLEKFAGEAVPICQKLKAHGYWADYTDPASGLPALGERHSGTYPEVLGAQHFLKYNVINAGCCQILDHPVFGTKVYPATLFTTAPLSAVLAILKETYTDWAMVSQSGSEGTEAN